VSRAATRHQIRQRGPPGSDLQGWCGGVTAPQESARITSVGALLEDAKSLMTDTEFAELLDLSSTALEAVVDDDWSEKAGTLDWSCWQTVDHMVDCIFSYAFQLAARARNGFLPFDELHAQPSAGPAELLAGVRAVGTLFLAVVRDSPPDATAADGVLTLSLEDWCARAAYELVLHTHDVLIGLGSTLSPPEELCQSIVASQSLWMFDGARASGASDAWSALLAGSGRPPRT